MLLIEHDLLTAAAVAASTREVWTERDGVEPPTELPVLPESWPQRYERLAAEYTLDAQTFTAAQALVGRLWTEMFRPEET